MLFDWDQQKHEKTLAERGIGFDSAALIFGGETIESVDERWDYGEVRVLAVGESDGNVLAVVYTERSDVRWIISARRASRKERKAWRER